MRISIIPVLVSVLFSSSCFAIPAPEVIQSCRESKAIEGVTKTNIDGFGFAYDYSDHCGTKYYSNVDGKEVAYLGCDDENFFIINGVKIPIAYSENLSQNPNFGPYSIMPNMSNWSKIVFDKVEYICIASSISDTGKGRSHEQYYLIENPFEGFSSSAYYLYFDKE